MAKPFLDERLWVLIEPHLPPKKRRRCGHPVRNPLDNRQVPTDIVFVLKTGIPWEFLLKGLGRGSGMTYWLPDWQRAGVWKRVHEVPGVLRSGHPGPAPGGRRGLGCARRADE
jgi:transposase